MNLVVNARDAMPQGGRLRLSARSVELTCAEAERRGGRKGGRYALISVCDTGDGMTESVRDRAFEPFFTTKAAGNGLGLASVYGTMVQSGGFVDIESEVGQGTRVHIHLPSEPGKADDAPAARGRSRGGHETILIVEDEAPVRAVAHRALARRGYRVLQAASAAEALEVAACHDGTFDLLLSDVVLPETGGGKLFERFRAIRPETRVLFMSGYPDDAVALHGVSKSQAAFIAKPFEPDGLEEAVRQALDAGFEQNSVSK